MPFCVLWYAKGFFIESLVCLEVKYLKEQTLMAKQAVVEDIKEKLEKSQSLVFLDYRGLTVEEVTNLRVQMRQAGVEYRVLKNTMIRKAAAELNIEGLDGILEGPTAVAFGFEDPVAPAKILVDFIKKAKKTEIKAGMLNGRVVSVEEVQALAELPSREELIAKMLGSLNAPVQGLVMVLSGVMRNFVCALNAIKEQKEQA